MTPLSIIGARSFWALVIGMAVQFVPWLSDADVEPLADLAINLVSALAAVWAWYERRAPSRSLVIRGPLK